jgi:hypothetical protein
MKKLFLLILVAAVTYAAWNRFDTVDGVASLHSAGDDVFASAFRNHTSGIQLSGKGMVTKILPDDNDGSRHQRFILKLPSGQTLLVAHNIDLAPRVASLRQGDSVEFNGVYEWNSKGGTIHWTHHDPQGRHEAGWLRHNGKSYQ